MSKAAAPTAVTVSPDDLAPGAEEVARLKEDVRGFARSERFERVRGFLRKLRAAPPQVLLLEGGTADERFAAARWWAVLLNCEPETAASAAPAQASLFGAPAASEARSNAETEFPCLDCSVCTRMIAGLHRDFFLLDGRAASIKVQEVRDLLPVLGEPPREASRRVVVLAEAQALGEAAANSLLKSLEEPRPGTVFVLLAPQRERLLPTLVSRSFALTLPWPTEAPPSERVARLAAALAEMAISGRGWIGETSGKGAVDVPLAHGLVNACRRALAEALSRVGAPEAVRQPGAFGALAGVLGKLPPARMRMLDEELAEAQDSLLVGVNPGLVLDRLAGRVFLLLPR